MLGIGWFLGGLLVGAKGKDIFGSKEAKKVYSKVISYGLDAKDCVMETADTLRENWDDVYADAKDMKDERDKEKDAEKEEIIEDTSDKTEKEEAAEKKTAAKRSTAKKSATASKSTTRGAGRAKKNS
ncbi:MAG: DUF6110 family protein [Lachnospiraceae bacterium]|nr:DUF6110 family protein [Lachnospiraceae bacterium]